ncbi:hypothetical protein C2G38_2197967 [Gigaspora rosea]|uniref:Uncharacterized protein n=1 Tax=Gigaspora rosea TaxID=44941 RepID=A0A397UT29_9GLOM|nr:hypothetical protein C2G38_2197967 [Gigaspora rosea]
MTMLKKKQSIKRQTISTSRHIQKRNTNNAITKNTPKKPYLDMMQGTGEKVDVYMDNYGNKTLETEEDAAMQETLEESGIILEEEKLQKIWSETKTEKLATKDIIAIEKYKKGVTFEINRLRGRLPKLINQLMPSEINKLADNYQNGIGIEKDERKAFELYLKADEMGNVKGTFNVGNCYYYGIGVERDLQKAFFYYQKFAEMGNADGMCNIGYCYNHRVRVETNIRKAHMYYQKAAKMGDMFAFGKCYNKGIGVEEDAKKAFEYYLNSAEMGNVKGIFEIGICYGNGIGVEKNYHKAFEYCQKSADIGDIVGTNEFGYYYYNGIGVKEYKNKVFEYFKKSADMGYNMATDGIAKGIHNVGKFYQKGIIVEKDIDIAFEWYLKSAITEQSSVNGKKEYFHWIPFENFENIEEIGKGAFRPFSKQNI